MMSPNLFEYQSLKPKKAIRRKELKPINNLKEIFRDIRDYFAGNVTGITRDEKIAQNIMRLLFCKIYDEQNNKDILEFSNRLDEDLKTFNSRFDILFDLVKKSYSEIFEKNEKIEVEGKALSYIVSKLEKYSILDADRDVIADAFEELIGRAFRGGEGQFFTPRNVVQMMIDVLQPSSNHKIIDPACGSGGFLAYALKYLIKKKSKNYLINGIDKDNFLSRIAKTYLSLIGGKQFDIFCENSLETPIKWKKETQNIISPNSYDIVLTNPPFGAKIPVVGEHLLKQYKLGQIWKNDSGDWINTKKIRDKQSPQVLFIERCIQLLKDKGKMGIVLPDGIFGNPSDKYIWQYIKSECSIFGIVSLAQETFQPSTHTKTSVLFVEKNKSQKKSVFMGIAENIGHNKNGKPLYKMDKLGEPIQDKKGKKIIDDDIPLITKRFKDHNKNELVSSSHNHLGFNVEKIKLKEDIFIPEYYNPEIEIELKNLNKTKKYDLISIGELVKKNIITITRGNEIGSQNYGTGTIPFVRTSDLVNWEIKFDPIKAISDEVYDQFKNSQNIKLNDILFVNDGTFLIGRTAMVTKQDIKIVIQSHVKKFRVENTKKLNPFYLFYLLNSKIVRKQILSKTFVQATISTIGNRIKEVILPISKNKNEILKITKEIQKIINEKSKLREKTVKIIEDSV